MEFTWPGKRQAFASALEPTCKQIEPAVWKDNLVVIGDNLDALKLLRTPYAQQVKVIYIDPPYNTGKSFVYQDDFRLHDKTLSKANRRHVGWLNMMSPRLLLSREFLREDGVIFISIDDKELAHLLLLMDEIYGFENRCGIIVWERKKKPSFLHGQLVNRVEYIVAYAKNRTKTGPFTHGEVQVGKRYPFNNLGNAMSTLTFAKHSVSFGLADGTVAAQNMSTLNVPCELLDQVTIRDGTNQNEFRMKGQWRYSQDTLDQFVRDNEHLSISKLPFRPNIHRSRAKGRKMSNLLLLSENFPTYEDAQQEQFEIFSAKVFDYPKPLGLICHLLGAVMKSDDIAMDFFAGTGTTGHATVALNAKDNGKRRFICIQRDEHKEDHLPISDLLIQKIKWAFQTHEIDTTSLSICNIMD